MDRLTSICSCLLYGVLHGLRLSARTEGKFIIPDHLVAFGSVRDAVSGIVANETGNRTGERGQRFKQL